MTEHFEIIPEGEPYSVNDLIPNVEDASVDEMYEAIAREPGSKLEIDDDGDIVMSGDVTLAHCFVISAPMMNSTLGAINLLRKFRRYQAEWMEQSVEGESPSGPEYIEALEFAMTLLVDQNERLKEKLADRDAVIEHNHRQYAELHGKYTEARSYIDRHQRRGW